MHRAIVEPHLSFCCSLWGCCSESKFDTLQKIKNRTARIITSSLYDASAALINQNLGWSNISNQARKETATLTHKSLNSLDTNNLGKLFTKCSDGRERFLHSSETDLKIPLLKTTSGQKAFSYRGKLWNILERATKLAPSLKAFKEQL